MAAPQEQSAGADPNPIFTVSTGHEDWITGLAWLPGDRVVTSSDDGTVRIWNSMDGTQVGSSMVHDQAVLSMVATKDGRIVTSCHEGEHLMVWNIDTQELMDGPWSNERHGPARHMALSPNEELLVSYHEYWVFLWEMGGTMRVKSHIGAYRDLLDGVQAISISPDNRKFAVSANTGLAIFDMAGGECSLGPFRRLDHSASDIVWSIDGARIFCGYLEEGNIRCFRSDTCEPIGGPWIAHTGSSHRLALSPDGKRLASCSSDKTVRFWDVESCNVVGEPLPHEIVMGEIAFSPSGEFFACTGHDDDPRVVIWRVPWWDDARKNLHSLLEMSAVVSPDTGGPSNVPDLDFFDIPASRRPVPPQDRSRGNPSRDPRRVQSSALSRWWKRIPRLVFHSPPHPIYPGRAEPRSHVASRSTISTQPSSDSDPPMDIVESSSEEDSSTEGSINTPTPDPEPEVIEVGCCGLISRRRPPATAARERRDVPVERSSHRTHPPNNNTHSAPTSQHPAMHDILELSAVA